MLIFKNNDADGADDDTKKQSPNDPKMMPQCSSDLPKNICTTCTIQGRVHKDIKRESKTNTKKQSPNDPKMMPQCSSDLPKKNNVRPVPSRGGCTGIIRVRVRVRIRI